MVLRLPEYSKDVHAKRLKPRRVVNQPLIGQHGIEEQKAGSTVGRFGFDDVELRNFKGAF
jgi:hypothetical protein